MKIQAFIYYLLPQKIQGEFIHYLNENDEERFPIDSGIAGYVYSTGTLLAYKNSYNHYLYNG